MTWYFQASYYYCTAERTTTNGRDRVSSHKSRKTVFRPISARLPPRSAAYQLETSLYIARRKNSPKVWSSFTLFGEPDRPIELSLNEWMTKVLCVFQGGVCNVEMYRFLSCEYCTAYTVWRSVELRCIFSCPYSECAAAWKAHSKLNRNSPSFPPRSFVHSLVPAYGAPLTWCMMDWRPNQTKIPRHGTVLYI